MTEITTKQFKLLVRDRNGAKQNVIFDAVSPDQAKREALNIYQEVIMIKEIPVSESLF